MRAARWAAAPLAALALLTGLAAAQGPRGLEGEPDDGHEDEPEEPLTPEQLRALHSKLDQDGDGRATMEEVIWLALETGKIRAKNDVEALLEEVDVNQDGKLSLAEHLDSLIAEVGDEYVDPEELEARKQSETEKHNAADEDDDGVLDSLELASLFYPETHAGVLRIAVRESMRQKDKDFDGKLTRVEFWESHEDGEDDEEELSDEEKREFRTLDEDKDGFLDQEELAEWESGLFHTRAIAKVIFTIADADKDKKLTADEMAAAAEILSSSDAQHHLLDWEQHAFEL